MEALILIDIQRDYFRKGKFPLQGMKGAARNTSVLLEKFRRNGMEVIHVQHLSKPGKLFFVEGTIGAEIHELVKPQEGEALIQKRFPNSFRDTELDQLLKKKDIKELHVAGAMTNMCIDSTVRAAFDLGYRVKLYEKCCAAPPLLGTKLIHRIFFKNLISRFAEPGEL